MLKSGALQNVNVPLCHSAETSSMTRQQGSGFLNILAAALIKYLKPWTRSIRALWPVDCMFTHKVVFTMFTIEINQVRSMGCFLIDFYLSDIGTNGVAPCWSFGRMQDCIGFNLLLWMFYSHRNAFEKAVDFRSILAYFWHVFINTKHLI